MFKNMNDIKIFNKYTLKILRLLSLRYYKEFYQREISKLTGVSVGMTSIILSKLYQYEIVKRRKSGKNCFYSFNLNSPIARYIKILLNIFEIYPLIRAVRNLCKKIILFGSCASGEDTDESDIDLLIIQSHENKKTRIKQIIQKFKPISKRKVSAVVLSEKEFIEMRVKEKVFYENVRKGIVVWNEREAK